MTTKHNTATELGARMEKELKYERDEAKQSHPVNQTQELRVMTGNRVLKRHRRFFRVRHKEPLTTENWVLMNAATSCRSLRNRTAKKIKTFILQNSAVSKSVEAASLAALNPPRSRSEELPSNVSDTTRRVKFMQRFRRRRSSRPEASAEVTTFPAEFVGNETKPVDHKSIDKAIKINCFIDAAWLNLWVSNASISSPGAALPSERSLVHLPAALHPETSLMLKPGSSETS